jgi:hypothetical protein
LPSDLLDNDLLNGDLLDNDLLNNDLLEMIYWKCSFLQNNSVAWLGARQTQEVNVSGARGHLETSPGRGDCGRGAV